MFWKLDQIPSGYVKIAIENGHWNSGFSHEKWWFSIAMLNYQRVYLFDCWFHHVQNCVLLTRWSCKAKPFKRPNNFGWGLPSRATQCILPHRCVKPGYPVLSQSATNPWLEESRTPEFAMVSNINHRTWCTGTGFPSFDKNHKMIAGCPKRLENFKQFPVIPKNQYNKMFKPLLLCHCFFFYFIGLRRKNTGTINIR